MHTAGRTQPSMKKRRRRKRRGGWTRKRVSCVCVCALHIEYCSLTYCPGEEEEEEDEGGRVIEGKAKATTAPEPDEVDIAMNHLLRLL